MKKIYILGALITFILGACESLELDVRTTLSADLVSTSYARTQNHNAGVYGVLQDGFMRIDGAMLASSCDEAEHTLETSNVHKFNTGAWNPYDNPDDVWARYFRGVRLANEFLTMADNVDLEILRLDPAQQTLYQTRLAEIKRWKYEVRFLRAYFYFELVKRYGGVPVITENIELSEDFSQVQRNTLDSCFNFIIAECDTATANLPYNYATSVTDFGRATKGASMALKSRALLYAASDLFNTPPAGYAHPELVSMPTTKTRHQRWQAAADAANDLIALSPGSTGYALSTGGYRALFQTYNNNELILVRRGGASNTFEQASFPIGFDMGQSGTTPSQNLVDAYEVKTSATTSETFDWNNSAHVTNIYNFSATLPARDPRLGFSVITNNSLFKGGLATARAVECWEEGRDGKGVDLATKTGYYLKKFVDENLNLLIGATSVHSWPLIRYAEILLNYAEAINEADPGNVALAKARVDQVRARTGVAMPALPAGLTQAEMRERIRNERRVEFAFEEHRPWDVRRWMLGETYFNVPLRGLKILQTDPGVFTYTQIEVENRVFETKMYLYPIPQSDLNIMTQWAQNPGW